MGEKWIQGCERILDEIKTMESLENRDRLDLVRSIRFALEALNYSLAGWMQWINNPEVCSEFNQVELEDIDKNLTTLVKSFLEYDIRISNEGFQKNVEKKTEESTNRRSLYV